MLLVPRDDIKLLLKESPSNYYINQVLDSLQDQSRLGIESVIGRPLATTPTTYEFPFSEPPLSTSIGGFSVYLDRPINSVDSMVVRIGAHEVPPSIYSDTYRINSDEGRIDFIMPPRSSFNSTLVIECSIGYKSRTVEADEGSYEVLELPSTLAGAVAAKVATDYQLKLKGKSPEPWSSAPHFQAIEHLVSDL